VGEESPTPTLPMRFDQVMRGDVVPGSKLRLRILVMLVDISQSEDQDADCPALHIHTLFRLLRSSISPGRQLGGIQLLPLQLVDVQSNAPVDDTPYAT
jgi:hypothetical protein